MGSLIHYECEYCGKTVDANALEVMHHCPESPNAKPGRPEWRALLKASQDLNGREGRDGPP